MTTTKEIVPLHGTLRGEERQRTCSVQARRSSMYERIHATDSDRVLPL